MDAEEKYPPKPGGMVDTVRKQRQAEQDQAAQASAGSVGEPSYEAVKVDVLEPEVIGARTLSVSTSLNSVQRILGADPNRKRAVVMTLDEPIVVCNSQTSASDNRNATNAAGQSAGGFVLLPVSSAATGYSPVSLEIRSRGEVWVAATSSTATRVSVWTESYADPAS